MKESFIDSLSFLEETFSQSIKQRVSKEHPLAQLFEKEYIQMSHDLDQTQLQESWSWRNVQEARSLATFLINDKGELDLEQVNSAIQYLKEHLYSLGPDRHQDDARREHILLMLNSLVYDKSLISHIQKISKPFFLPNADKLIRETLLLSSKDLITDADAKRACLAAAFTYLRQNVGSCFATAPAILIQQELPLQFFADLNQLLSVGYLKRTFEGVEHIVPLSPSWGVGDLRRPFYITSFGKEPWTTLAKAPGLIAAFISSGLIEISLSRQEKNQRLEELLLKTSLVEESKDPFLVISADIILQTVLMSHFQITKEDLKQYELRPKEIRFSEYMITTPSPRGGKDFACSLYYVAYENAKNAFKAITDNPLLKAWEFTLASFAETKADFAKWNLYSSLGLDPESPYGIGRCFFEILQAKIDDANQEIEHCQSRYEYLYAQAKNVEGRLSHASSERELGWLQTEYRMRKNELDRLIVERDQAYEKGQRLSALLPFIIKFYTEKFKEYFQEIYDPDMHEVKTGPYDDSPAGFRLLYKHGRSSTASWTMIYTPAEYVEALTSFFVATEVELSYLPEINGLQLEVSELVTSAILLIKNKEFLEHSINRLALAYGTPLIKDPLDHLESISRKPWVYISGGTMTTLVSAYWMNSRLPQEKTKWVESETELLAFYLDTMKDLPGLTLKKFQADPLKPMLAFSPTHAFLFQPGRSPLIEGWLTDQYAFTWIRDRWVVPAQRFYRSLELDRRTIDRIIDEVAQKVPSGYEHFFRKSLDFYSYTLSPQEFRQEVIRCLSYEKWAQSESALAYFAEEIDSILYANLPFFPEYELRERLEFLFQSMDDVDQKLYQLLFYHFEDFSQTLGRYKVLSAKDLKNVAKALLILSLKSTKTPLSYHQKIVHAMQKNGLSVPKPILFGDTNWVKNLFGFVVNPGTEALELWRLDFDGGAGRPMTQWKKWVTGVEQKPWGLFTAPYEYGL